MGDMFFNVGPGEAGVSASVTENSPQVASGDYGITLMLAPYNKGITGVASRVRDKGGFRRVCGRVLEDDYSGVAAHAFLDLANGAGQLHTWRVTDSELEGEIGELRLLARKRRASVATLLPITKASEAEPKVAQRAYALSPGAWAGAAFQFAGQVDDSNISGRTLTMGTAFNDVWLANELVGAKFKIGTYSGVFTIVSNTASDASNGPTWTFDRSFEGYTATSGNVLFRLYRENLDDDSNRREATIRVTDDGTRPGTRWGATIGLDGGDVSPVFQDLDLADQAAITRDIADAVVTGYAEIGLDATGQDVPDTALPQYRPCNWSGVALPNDITAEADIGEAKVTSDRLYLSIYEWIVDTASGNKPVLTSAPTIPSTCIPQKWTLTFTSASAFTATVTDPYTGEEIVKAAQLPTGGTGAAYPTAASVFDDHPDLVSFTITADASIASGTIMELWVTPLPLGLKNRNARLYGSAWSGTGRTDASTDPGTNTSAPDISTNWRIIDNGVNWVKVQGSDSMATAVQAPKAPVARGTDTSNSHDTTTTPTFIYNIEIDGVDKHSSDITLTMADIGGTATTAAVATELNTKSDAAQGDLFFYADSSDRLCVAVKDGNAGAHVTLAIKNGGVNSLVGITDASDHVGDDGAVMRIEYDQGLQNARYEAGQVAVADLQAELVANDSNDLFNWVRAQAGLVNVYMPGISDATTVQALIDFCAAAGAWARFDLPNTLATEAAAIAWVQANLSITDRVYSTHYPSWGETTRSPRESARETVPLGGLILGAEAAWANDPSEGVGYHKAPAGQHVRLDPWVSRLIKDTTATLNVADLLKGAQTKQGPLNLAGIQPIMQSGRSFYVFGDEAANPQFKGRYWIHKMRATLHIVAVLRFNLSSLVYHVNNSTNRAKCVRDIRALLKPLSQSGWFDPREDGFPNTFDGQVAIQCDELNNPQAVRDAGRLLAAVQFRIVNTIKNVEIGINTGGISVAA